MNTLKRPDPTNLLLFATLALSGCFSPEQTQPSDTDEPSSPTTSTSGMPQTSGTTTEETTGVSTGGTSGEGTTGAPTSDDDSGSTTGNPSGDDTTSSAGEETSSSGEPVVCGDGGVCIPAIPDGWNGPVATRTIGIEEDIPPCGGEAYTDLQVSDAFAGLQADDYECGCECNPGSLSCAGDAELQLSDYPPGAGLSPCTSPNYVYDETIASGAPQSVSIPMADIRGVVLGNDPSTNVAGSCTPNATTQASPAGFGTRTIACGTFDGSPQGCGDGLCVPQPSAPYEAGVCVWAEGDLDCPAGFDDRTLYHSDFSDTRDCTACTCGSASGSCENASIRVRGWCDVDGSICFGPTCGPGGTFPCEEDFEGTIADFSVCEPIGAVDFCTPLCGDGEICASCSLSHTLEELRDITYQAGTPDASCPPSGGNPIGSVSGTEPLTMCCAT